MITAQAVLSYYGRNEAKKIKLDARKKGRSTKKIKDRYSVRIKNKTNTALDSSIGQFTS